MPHPEIELTLDSDITFNCLFCHHEKRLVYVTLLRYYGAEIISFTLV
jgi:hypothetical protein